MADLLLIAPDKTTGFCHLHERHRRKLVRKTAKTANTENSASPQPWLRVLHVTAELYPWVKSGGLGDVAAALPPALAEFGVDVRLLLPGFAGFLDAFPGITDVARLHTPFSSERVRVSIAPVPGSKCAAYLVDQPAFYDRPGNPYAGPDGRDWPDNHRRFGLFAWIAAALARGADPGWTPDILHVHDWHAGLAPAYLAARALPGSVRTVFTIHNLAYQGLFPAGLFPELALPAEFFSIDGVEFNGQVSFHQGRVVLCGPPDHGKPDLCPRDPDRGFRLRSRWAIAHPRRLVDGDTEWGRPARLGSSA